LLISTRITRLRFELQGHSILHPVGRLLTYLYMSWPSEHLLASSEQQRVTSPHTFACGQVRVDAITVCYPVGIRLSVFVFILAGIACYLVVLRLSIDLRGFCITSVTTTSIFSYFMKIETLCKNIICV